QKMANRAAAAATSHIGAGEHELMSAILPGEAHPAPAGTDPDDMFKAQTAGRRRHRLIIGAFYVSPAWGPSSVLNRSGVIHFAPGALLMFGGCVALISLGRTDSRAVHIRASRERHRAPDDRAPFWPGSA